MANGVFSVTGLGFGQRIFPRSFVKAALMSATVAACRDHDRNTGRKSFQLFRFPWQIERQLGDILDRSNDWKVPGDQDGLMAELAEIQSNIKMQKATGPKSLGPRI